MSGQPARCVLLLESDWQAVVLRLKALCLAYGGSAADCQTEALRGTGGN